MTAPHAPASPSPSTDASLEIPLQAAIAGEGLELPPLPQVAIEAANLAADGEGGAVALAKLIQRDIALASQVMRVANSSLYSRRAPVVSLHQAIAWLGVDAIRNIALAFAVRAQLFGVSAFEPQLRALWRESVSVGCFAQEIARAKRRNVETAYLCGLLHRVGLAVILWRLGRASLDAGVQVEDESMESFVGGFEGQVGAQLARAWNLPEPVAAAILWFRSPAKAQHSKLDVAQVALARALAAHLDDDELSLDTLELPPTVVSDLGFYPVELGRLLERREDIRAAVETFL
jgi:HD-like signal output (HDOD) protein